MKKIISYFLLTFLICGIVNAHTNSQLVGEYKAPKNQQDTWEIEFTFEAGFATPSIRDDPDALPPKREWLLERSAEEQKNLKIEAERFLREMLIFREGGTVAEWAVIFPDWDTTPPSFPKLMDGAYFRAVAKGKKPLDQKSLEASCSNISKNDWIFLMTPDEEDEIFMKISAGENAKLQDGETVKETEAKITDIAKNETVLVNPITELPQDTEKNYVTKQNNTFLLGFQHVLPDGWDHVLFILGLFFLGRRWKPLMWQSLAFTAAHTITLGLASSGTVKIGGTWVEVLIALSIAAVAFENLRASREITWQRLLVIFSFGLIHGLGFAGAMSEWMKPGKGFVKMLVFANLGVEAAQVTILLLAWILTMIWWRTKSYEMFRKVACIAIGIIGLYWAFDRAF
jgi:HupE / UreJ protein